MKLNGKTINDGDVIVEYIYCDENSTVNVIKMIFNASVNKKHKYQTDITFLRENVSDSLGCFVETVAIYKKEDDPKEEYDEYIDARNINMDIAARCNFDAFGFDIDENDGFDDGVLYVDISDDVFYC